MRKRGRLLVVLPLALLFLAQAAATSADTPIDHSGSYGAHYLADTEEFPGVRCSYDSSSVIRGVRVQDPLVFARNRVANRIDSQQVSWFFRVRARTAGSGDWTTVATSAVQKRTATDAQVANFSPMSKAFAGNAGKEYRVQVVMRWYAQDGATVVGRAVHRADWYSWEGVPSFEGLCPGGVF
jgi:hypothetical protein